MKKQGCVPIKLTLKTQVMDRIWPTDQSLPSPLLGQGVRGDESKRDIMEFFEGFLP